MKHLLSLLLLLFACTHLSHCSSSPSPQSFSPIPPLSHASFTPLFDSQPVSSSSSCSSLSFFSYSLPISCLDLLIEATPTTQHTHALLLFASHSQSIADSPFSVRTWAAYPQSIAVREDSAVSRDGGGGGGGRITLQEAKSVTVADRGIRTQDRGGGAEGRGGTAQAGAEEHTETAEQSSDENSAETEMRNTDSVRREEGGAGGKARLLQYAESAGSNAIGGRAGVGHTGGTSMVISHWDSELRRGTVLYIAVYVKCEERGERVGGGEERFVIKATMVSREENAGECFNVCVGGMRAKTSCHTVRGVSLKVVHVMVLVPLSHRCHTRCPLSTL